MVDVGAYGRTLLEETAADLAGSVTTAIPRLLRAALLLAIAYVVIRAVTGLLDRLLDRAYPGRQALVADLVATLVRIGLWFAVALAVLAALGLERIAASLGTATGFVALGVAYALSEMIEDTVAGVYLLRDPDFEPGDRVETDDGTGTVQSIELRKCRIETDDGDVVVQANRNVESGWTKLGEPSG